MTEAIIIQLFVFGGVLLTVIPTYIKVLRPMRQENARDHAVVQTTLAKVVDGQAELVKGQAAGAAWREQHDLRHQDLQDRLHDLSS